MTWFSLTLFICISFGALCAAQDGSSPKKYKVISIVSPPFVNPPNASGAYTGYVIDFLEKFKADGVFDYTFTISPDGVYGDKLADGTTTGLIHAIASGEYDIAATDLTVTVSRSEAVDFVRFYDRTVCRVAINSNYDNQTATYYAISSIPLLNYLKQTKLPEAAAIWQNIQSRATPYSSEGILDTPAKIAAVVNRIANGENLALVGVGSNVQNAIQPHNDTVFYSSLSFYSHSNAMAVKLGSPLRRFLSLKVLNLAETGYGQNLHYQLFGQFCSGNPRPPPTTPVYTYPPTTTPTTTTTTATTTTTITYPPTTSSTSTYSPPTTPPYTDVTSYSSYSDSGAT